MNHSTLKLALPLLVALAAGCTTMGTGVGATDTGADSVAFSWKSSDDVSGTLNAALAGGTTFSGQYFQITGQTRVDTLGPLWDGWHRGRRSFGWGDWDYGPSFITHYSGRVVANLAASDGQHMRCRFQLVHPSNGMAGGGRGQCQMPDGTTIDATFPAV